MFTFIVLIRSLGLIFFKSSIDNFKTPTFVCIYCNPTLLTTEHCGSVQCDPRIHVNIEKSKTEAPPEEPSNHPEEPSNNVLAIFFRSTCLFWLKNIKRYRVTKDTHVSYTSNWILSHIICKMRGRGNESEDGEGQKCGVVRFSLLLSCVRTALQFQKATHAPPRGGKPVSNWHLFMDSTAARQKFLYIKKSPLNT